MVNSQFQVSAGGMGMGGGMVPGSAPVNLPPRYPSQLDSQPSSVGGMAGPMGSPSTMSPGGGLNQIQMLPNSNLNQGMNPGVVAGGGGGVGGGGPPGPPSSADPEKRKLIQQQLVLLLHAHKCQRRDREQQAQGQGAEVRQCTLPHCRTMKDVLNHMTTCQAGKTCTVPHCSSSRQIIAHWKHCNRQDCPVCLPLKQADTTRRNPNDMMSPPGPLGGGPRPPGPPQQHMAGVPPNGTAAGQPSQANLEAARRALGIPQDNQQQQPRPQMPGMSLHQGGQMNPQQQQQMVRPGGMPPGMMGPGGPRMAQQSPISRPSIPVTGTYDQIASTLMEPNRNILPDEIQNTVTAAPVQCTKEWHNMVTPDLRNHLVHKLVQVTFTLIALVH